VPSRSPDRGAKPGTSPLHRSRTPAAARKSLAPVASDSGCCSLQPFLIPATSHSRQAPGTCATTWQLTRPILALVGSTASAETSLPSPCRPRSCRSPSLALQNLPALIWCLAAANQLIQPDRVRDLHRHAAKDFGRGSAKVILYHRSRDLPNCQGSGPPSGASAGA
jgi:hypothetical protein